MEFTRTVGPLARTEIGVHRPGPPLRFGPGYANEWTFGPESQSTFHHARPPDEWPPDQSRASFVESRRQRHARCETGPAAIRQASGWASALRVRSPPPQESHSEGFRHCPAARHPLPTISETHGCRCGIIIPGEPFRVECDSGPKAHPFK